MAIGGEPLLAECVQVLITATTNFLKMRWKHHLDRALLRELDSGNDQEGKELEGCEVKKGGKQHTVRNRRNEIAKKYNL